MTLSGIRSAIKIEFVKCAVGNLAWGQIFLALLFLSWMLYQVISYNPYLDPANRIWSCGDWLINYNGGFIRRGLGGWLLIGLANATNIPVSEVVVGAQRIFHCIIYIYLFGLCLKTRPMPFLLLLALFSPAAFLFPVNAVGSIGRKEIVVLAWAGAMAWKASNGVRPTKLFLSVCFAVFVALHDGLFFFLPLFCLYLSFLFLEETWDLRTWFWICSPAAALMALILWMGPADGKTIAAIIHAFQGNVKDWDMAAIGFLRCGFKDAIHFLQANTNPLTLTRTLLGAGLGFAPFVLWYYFGGEKILELNAFFKKPQIKVLALCVGLFQLALFVIAIDWGRWLMVDFCFLGFACLSACQQSALRSVAESAQKIPWPCFIGISGIYWGCWQVSCYGWLGVSFLDHKVYLKIKLLSFCIPAIWHALMQ